MQSQNEIRQKITDQIIVALSSGTLPIWRKTWQTIGCPINVISCRKYRGINTLILALHREKYNFTSKWYGTYNQWKQLGGIVKKRPNEVISGEWCASIIYYNIISKKVEDRYTGIEEEKTFPILKNFSVFSIDQVEGNHLNKFRIEKETIIKNEFVNYEPADQIIAKTGAEISFGGDKAFYRPSSDSIRLPHKQSFENSKEFYATAFHELIHWSEKRCGWSGSYAEGELRAEIGAAFLLSELGIPQSDNLENHHAYLEHWLSHLQKDNRFIFKASTAASKAVDYLLQRNNQELQSCD